MEIAFGEVRTCTGMNVGKTEVRALMVKPILLAVEVVFVVPHLQLLQGHSLEGHQSPAFGAFTVGGTEWSEAVIAAPANPHLSCSSISRTTFAGFPATTCQGGTSRVTTEPAPTIAPSPIVTPFRMIERAPIQAPRPI